MQQRVPLAHEPLQQGEQIPVRRLDPLTFFQVCAKVPSIDPDLKCTPGQGDVRRRTLLLVRVVHERNSDGECARIAGQALPVSSHRSIPVLLDVPASDALLLSPPASELGRHFLPPNRVFVPDTGPMFLRAVCLTVVYRVSLGFYQFAVGQQFRCNAANLPGAQ